MNDLTHHYLTQLGFESVGDDADFLDHEVYANKTKACATENLFSIVVNKRGCELKDLATIIYLAGRNDAKKEIRHAWSLMEKAIK